MRRILLLGVLACAACADLLGVHEFTYVPDEGGIDSPLDAIADAASDSPSDADAQAPDAGCVLCADAGPAPCALSCNETSPKWLAMDQTRIYWASIGATTTALRTLVRPNGAPAQVTSFAPAPNALAATGEQVVWTDGSLLRVAMLDGGVKTLATTAGASSVAGPPPQQAAPIVYWTSGGADAGIWRCALPDCTNMTLQIDQRNNPRGLSVVWDNNAAAPYGFWVDTGDVQRPVLGAVVLGGYTVVPYAMVPTSTGVMAAQDKTKVYFAAFSAGTSDVYLAGDNNPKLTAAGVVRGLAAAGGDLWVTVDDVAMPENGKIVKVLGGGGSQTVAAQQNQPWGVVVDGAYVYWTTLGGTVMRAGR